jgi:hypothetical protein
MAIVFIGPIDIAGIGSHTTGFRYLSHVASVEKNFWSLIWAAQDVSGCHLENHVRGLVREKNVTIFID